MTVTPNFDPRQYGALLAQTLPSVSSTEAENDRMFEAWYELMSKGEDNFTPEESKLLRLLECLIEHDIAQTCRGEAGPPYLTLQRLMSDEGVRQKDLLDIFGSSGIASEVCHGKRGISKTHAKKLADYFVVPADLFL